MSGSSRIAVILMVIIIVWFFVYYQRCASPVMDEFDSTGSITLTEGDSIGVAPGGGEGEGDRANEPFAQPPLEDTLRNQDGPVVSRQDRPNSSANGDGDSGASNVSPGEAQSPESATDSANADERPLPPPPLTFPYTVKGGDTMESIAAEWFGDKRKWVLIAQENPTVDPIKLKAGRPLRLPPRNARLEDLPPDVLEQLMRQVRYLVSRGDTLSSIAKQFYGDPNLWPIIYEANRDVLASPDSLQQKMELVIPPHQIPADDETDG